MSNAASSVCFHAFVSTCAFVFLLSGYLAVELLDCMLNFNCQSESESRSAVSSSVTALDYTVLGIPQGKTLEWVAFPFSRGSSQPRDRTPFSHIAGRFFTTELQGKTKNTGVDSLSLLQQIFPAQELKLGLLHFRWILYQ